MPTQFQLCGDEEDFIIEQIYIKSYDKFPDRERNIQILYLKVWIIHNDMTMPI